MQRVVSTELTTIEYQITEAAEHLSAIRTAMSRYREVESRSAFREIVRGTASNGKAPMLPAVPSRVRLEARNGKGRYMYLYFGVSIEDGAYTGPEGATKLYVGCDPAAQARALTIVENRRRFDELKLYETLLARWIDARTASVSHVAHSADGWPRADLAALRPMIWQRLERR
jgi:hypothetical protein